MDHDPSLPNGLPAADGTTARRSAEPIRGACSDPPPATISGATAVLASGDLRRVVADLAAAELSALHLPSGEAASPGSRSGCLPIDAVSGPVDLLAVASAVDRMFHLDESGREEALLADPSIDVWADVVQESLGASGYRVSFPVSGVAGTAAVVTHTVPQLAALARQFAAALPGRRRVLALVPAHRPYGFLWTVLFPAVAGVECIDARGWTPGQVQARARGGDVVIASPERWARVDAQVRWAADVVGVSSSGPCPAEAAARQRAAGLARLVDVYGCARCAAVGWRDDPAGPFHLLDGWTRFVDHLPERPIDDAAMPDLERVADGARIRLPDRLAWEGPRAFRLAAGGECAAVPATVAAGREAR
jgi:long-chain acyl-CoA synthetase